MATIRIKRGDTYIKTLSVKNQGELVDCTGWTIWFTVRESQPTTLTTDDTDAIISKEISGEATGEHTLSISSTDSNITPKSYIFDCQVKKADGSIYSTETGNFIIQGDITRSR